MPPRSEGSILKRARASSSSPGADAGESFKKARRSDRLQQPRQDNEDEATGKDRVSGSKSKNFSKALERGEKTPIITNQQHLPSPLTYAGLADDESGDKPRVKESTAEPPDGRQSQLQSQKRQDVNFGSPPNDTQDFGSQSLDPNRPLSSEVEDEVKEGVWGYLFPLDTRHGGSCHVMRKRTSCPRSGSVSEAVAKKSPGRAEPFKSPAGESREYDETKVKGIPSGGYLIGRHPECDIVVDDPIVSNRHCLLFTENKGSDSIAILEDLSSNGAFVNDAIVGRNQRRELKEGDEIAVAGNNARFVFKYPRCRQSSAFLQQYMTLEKLGKGHFAEVYLCVEKSTGQRFAVKIFTKTPGLEERSKDEGLQQEIGILQGVSHPNMLCLKDVFIEPNAVYLVLELAPEGELFNYIVQKQKLSEAESRKLFVQLFQAVKYLHDRQIVHRDIKPENILLVDRDLHVKLADFGLAKIIGEQSFTTTLCGTPSYVAPEILSDSKQRRYTNAVDVWSLGVVLYICLCGFPPFSDELYSKEFPYTLSQQIKKGRFDYPSPYWDSVGDPALDLIDSMLVVDPAKRFTVDQCLNHPWTRTLAANVNDSTEGLISGVRGLDVENRRGAQRERTLLSSINSLELTNTVRMGNDKPDLKIYAKNPIRTAVGPAGKEARPDDRRQAGEFMEMGGRGDEVLYGDEGSVYYQKNNIGQAPTPSSPSVEDKGKVTVNGVGR